MKMLCIGRVYPQFVMVEVLPGLWLALWPGEDVAEIAEAVRNLFAETDGMFPAGEPLTAEEVKALEGAPADFAEAVASRERWSWATNWEEVENERIGD